MIVKDIRGKEFDISHADVEVTRGNNGIPEYFVNGTYKASNGIFERTCILFYTLDVNAALDYASDLNQTLESGEDVPCETSEEVPFA
ncbi:MAG: hypothetical protein IKL28_05340 [Lachnospiraceae bacterium]|nr:hypothetical protein [Lachnospiraceae bacterium]